MLGFHSISEYPISTIQVVTIIRTPEWHKMYQETPKWIEEPDTDRFDKRAKASNEQILLIIKAFITCH